MSKLKVAALQGLSASSDAITLANDGTCTANITSIGGGQLSNRNKVINGSMIIHQRGGSKTGNEYTLDRFHVSSSTDGAYSVSQSTESPDDFSNSLHVNCTTADTSVASGQYLQLKHAIEGQNLQDLAKGTSSAKKTVLSFYVKTNLTGTYGIAIYDGDNTRSFTTTYTVSNTNWNRYTIDIPADTTGVLDNDNGESIGLYWFLVQGSNRTSGSASTSWGSYTLANFAVGHNVNFLSSTDNNWYLTGVQFEKSDTGVATDFEHRSYGQELALCRRYCYVHAEGLNTPLGNGTCWTASSVFIPVIFPVKMRAAPTMTVTTGTNYYSHYYGGTSANESGANFSLAVSLDTGCEIYDNSTNVTQNASCFSRNQNAACKITLSAEL